MVQEMEITEEEGRRKLSMYVDLKEKNVDKQWKKVWMVFNRKYDELQFYNEEKDKLPFLQLSVKQSTIREESIKTEPYFFFSVEIFGTKYLLRFETEEELREWITTLNDPYSNDDLFFLDHSESEAESGEENFGELPLETSRTLSVCEEKVIDPQEIPGDDNFFHTLSDELLVKIWAFLDAPHVGKVALVCKRFKHISYDLPLWKEMSRKKNWDLYKTGHPGMPKEATRSFYIAKFLSFRKRQKQIEEQRVQDVKNRKMQKNKENSGKLLLGLCFGRPYEWFAALSLIWVTILSALRLDGVIDWHWAFIFLPFFLVILQILLAPLFYDVISTRYDYNFEDELDPDDNQLCGPIFFFLAFVLPMSESRSTGRAALFPMTISFSCFLLLAIARICGAVGIPWWVVFLPLGITLLWTNVIILWIAGYDHCCEDEQRFDRLVPSLGTLLVLLFLIFCALKLEGAIDWTWYSVMIPLFVLKGLFVLLPVILSILTIYFDHTGSYWLEDRSRWADHTGSYCLTVVLVTLLVLGPLLAFELLIAERLENPEDSPSYSLIFIPLFILEGFGLCGCCAVNCAFLCS